MKTIAVKNDLYDLIMKKVAQTGDNPSSVMRTWYLSRRNGSPSTDSRSQNTQEKGLDAPSEKLVDFIESPRFQFEGNATKKYLAVLSFAYQQKPDKFAELEHAVYGSSRKYFGKSWQELSQSGKSVEPQRIPDSPYWTTTNFATSRKRTILGRVLRVLDYEAEVREQASAAL